VVRNANHPTAALGEVTSDKAHAKSVVIGSAKTDEQGELKINFNAIADLRLSQSQALVIIVYDVVEHWRNA